MTGMSVRLWQHAATGVIVYIHTYIVCPSQYWHMMRLKLTQRAAPEDQKDKNTADAMFLTV